jgi:hypothetical protein
VESLPGFVRWIEDAEGAGQGAVFSISRWGLRRSAAFDRQLEGSELERAIQLLDQLPKEYDPMAEMRIEVWTYFLVTVDVSGLHLAPADRRARIYPLLDPTRRMGGVGLRNMAVSRVRKAVASHDAARALMDELSELGLVCELERRETFVTPKMISEDARSLEQEVRRRRAHGGELVEVPIPEGRASMFDRFDV